MVSDQTLDGAGVTTQGCTLASTPSNVNFSSMVAVAATIITLKPPTNANKLVREIFAS